MFALLTAFEWLMVSFAVFALVYLANLLHVTLELVTTVCVVGNATGLLFLTP